MPALITRFINESLENIFLSVEIKSNGIKCFSLTVKLEKNLDILPTNEVFSLIVGHTVLNGDVLLFRKFCFQVFTQETIGFFHLYGR